MHTIEISEHDAGQRLDKFLRKVFKTVPLSALYRWMRKGKVKVNRKKVPFSYHLESGDELVLYIPDADLLVFTEKKTFPDTGPLPPVIYEDQSLLIINKPSGLAVHGGTGISEDHLTARVRSYLHAAYSSKSLSYSPNPVHRLDRETSGLIVYAKNLTIHKKLCSDLKNRRWKKWYLSFAVGYAAKSSGSITHDLSDKSDPGKKMSATTFFEIISSNNTIHVIKLVPETGRFHQLRRHLVKEGFVILGDRKYAHTVSNNVKDKTKANRLYLHAYYLDLLHPVSGKKMKFLSEIPDEFHKMAKQLDLNIPQIIVK